MIEGGIRAGARTILQCRNARAVPRWKGTVLRQRTIPALNSHGAVALALSTAVTFGAAGALLGEKGALLRLGNLGLHVDAAVALVLAVEDDARGRRDRVEN